jgi:hypothetical protein
MSSSLAHEMLNILTRFFFFFFIIIIISNWLLKWLKSFVSHASSQLESIVSLKGHDEGEDDDNVHDKNNIVINVNAKIKQAFLKFSAWLLSFDSLVDSGMNVSVRASQTRRRRICGYLLDKDTHHSDHQGFFEVYGCPEPLPWSYSC